MSLRGRLKRLEKKAALDAMRCGVCAVSPRVIIDDRTSDAIAPPPGRQALRPCPECGRPPVRVVIEDVESIDGERFRSGALLNDA